MVVYRHQKRLSSGVSDEGIARQEAAFEEVPARARCRSVHCRC